MGVSVRRPVSVAIFLAWLVWSSACAPSLDPDAVAFAPAGVVALVNHRAAVRRGDAPAKGSGDPLARAS